jgi:hypothetical protein
MGNKSMADNELNLVVTEDRLNDVPLEVFYGVDSSPKSQLDFIAHFAQDDKGNYLPKAAAIKAVLKGRKLSDIASITASLQEAMEQAAVPNK